MMKEQVFKNVWKTAYWSAYSILHDPNDAEDIAQVSVLKLFVKNIPVKNPQTWIVVVAQNEAKRRIKEKEKFVSLENSEKISSADSFDQTDLRKYTEKDYQPPEDLHINNREAKALLNTEDYQNYKIYKKCNTNIHLFAKQKKITENKAKNMIYKMKRNLRAAKLLKEGYIGTKQIINYNFNKRIIYFIKIFTEKLKKNEANSLSKYFEFCEEKIPDLRIEKYFDYEIRKLDKNKFSLSIPYLDDQRKPNVISIIFFLNKKNMIKITEFKKPKAIYKLKSTKKEILKNFKPLYKGSLQETKKEASKLMKDSIKKKYKII